MKSREWNIENEKLKIKNENANKKFKRKIERENLKIKNEARGIVRADRSQKVTSNSRV